MNQFSCHAVCSTLNCVQVSGFRLFLSSISSTSLISGSTVFRKSFKLNSSLIFSSVKEDIYVWCGSLLVYILDQLCSMLSVHVFPLSNIEERSFAQVRVLRHVCTVCYRILALMAKVLHMRQCSNTARLCMMCFDLFSFGGCIPQTLSAVEWNSQACILTDFHSPTLDTLIQPQATPIIKPCTSVYPIEQPTGHGCAVLS